MEANQTLKTTFLNRSGIFPLTGEPGLAFAQTHPANYRFKPTILSPLTHTKNRLKNIISAPE